MHMIFALICYWVIGVIVIFFIERVIELIEILMPNKLIYNFYDIIVRYMKFELSEFVNHSLLELVIDNIIRLFLD